MFLLGFYTPGSIRLQLFCTLLVHDPLIVAQRDIGFECFHRGGDYTVQMPGVCSAVYGTVHYKVTLRVGISPNFWLPSVAIVQVQMRAF